MNVSEINIRPVKPDHGLVAFASYVINNQLYVGSLGVHQRLDGAGYRITYPTKKVGSRLFNYFHPVSKEAGKIIEQAVIAKCVELFERSDKADGRHHKTVDNHTPSVRL